MGLGSVRREGSPVVVQAVPQTVCLWVNVCVCVCVYDKLYFSSPHCLEMLDIRLFLLLLFLFFFIVVNGGRW